MYIYICVYYHNMYLYLCIYTNIYMCAHNVIMLSVHMCIYIYICVYTGIDTHNVCICIKVCPTASALESGWMQSCRCNVFLSTSTGHKEWHVIVRFWHPPQRDHDDEYRPLPENLAATAPR